MGMMNDILISCQESKGGNAQFLMCVGPGSANTRMFEKHTDNREKWEELANQDTAVYLVQKHSVLKGCKSFPKKRTEAR